MQLLHSDTVSAVLDSFNAVKLCAIQDPRCFMLADKDGSTLLT